MFQIGDFSKISQVPVSQLRYYDEIGLFQAAKIDSHTGYRYYNATQLPLLNRIIALKALGLSLKQIGQLIQDDLVADEIRGMLALKKAQIEQSLEEEASRLKIVEARLRQIDQEGKIRNDDVVIKSIPALLYLSMRRILPQLFDIRSHVHELKSRLPMRLGAENLENFTVIFHDNAFQIEDIDAEIGYVVNNRVESPLRLPSGEQITTPGIAPH